MNSPKIYFHVEFTWLTFRLSFSFRSSISLIFFKMLELRLNVVFYKSSSSYKCRPLINIVVFSFVLYTIKLVGRSPPPQIFQLASLFVFCLLTSWRGAQEWHLLGFNLTIQCRTKPYSAVQNERKCVQVIFQSAKTITGVGDRKATNSRSGFTQMRY